MDFIGEKLHCSQESGQTDAMMRILPDHDIRQGRKRPSDDLALTELSPKAKRPTGPFDNIQEGRIYNVCMGDLFKSMEILRKKNLTYELSSPSDKPEGHCFVCEIATSTIIKISKMNERMVILNQILNSVKKPSWVYLCPDDISILCHINSGYEIGYCIYHTAHSWSPCSVCKINQAVHDVKLARKK